MQVETINYEHYRQELVDTMHKSQEGFERQLSYISSGAIALSVTFSKTLLKGATGADKIYLEIGWLFLVLTLLINLLSHLWAVKLYSKCITAVDTKIGIEKSANKFNSINFLNRLCSFLLAFGVLFILFFISKTI
jgi:hypothetical protein